MKINKNKFLVLTLSSAALFSLVGSITGTFAWYQYSTRATAGIIGSSQAVTKNLQISTDGTNWVSDLKSTDIYNAAKTKTGNEHVGEEIQPLTSGDIEKDGKLTALYDAPTYQNFGDYSKWKNELGTGYTKYLTFDLYFRFTQNINSEESYTAKDVKLIDLTILGYDEDGETENGDLAKALRVHFSNVDPKATEENPGDSVFALASKEGGKTATVGTLDLNGDGKADTSDRYEWETTGTAGSYGKGEQVCYTKDELLGSVQDGGTIKDGVVLTTTKAGTKANKDTGASNKVTVTIWLEGWQKVGEEGSTSATWSEDTFKNSIFKVGMQFACDAD